MKKILSIIVLVTLLVGILPATIVSAWDYQLYEFWEYQDTSSLYAYGVNATCGQLIIPSADHYAYTIKLKMFRHGDDLGDFSVNIYAVDGALQPTGSSLAYGTYDTGLLTDGNSTNAEWHTISLGTHVDNVLGAGTAYFIQISYPAGDINNFVGVASGITDLGAAGWAANSQSNDPTLVYDFDRDICFKLYGVGAGTIEDQLSVEVDEAITSVTGTGNYSVTIHAHVKNSYLSQNVTAYMSHQSAFLTGNITLYQKSTYIDSDGELGVIFTDQPPGGGNYGYLVEGTTYYYKATVNYDGTPYSSIVKSVTPEADGIVKPNVALRKIEDISTQFPQYSDVIEITGKYVEISDNGTVISSPIINSGFLLSTYAATNGDLAGNIITLYPHDHNDDGTFIRRLFLDDSDWYNDSGVIYVQAFVDTLHFGRLHTSSVRYVIDDDSAAVGNPSDPSGTDVEVITDAINRSLVNRGFGNTVGKFIIILVLMTIAYFVTDDRRVKSWGPLLIFGIGILIGWVPIWLTVLLALGAGLTVYQLTRKKIQGT